MLLNPLETVLLLLMFQHGADPTKKNRDGNTPLDMVKEGDTDIQDLLRGDAALLDAAKKGCLARVQKLCSPENINCRDTQGRNSTPLHLAGKAEPEGCLGTRCFCLTRGVIAVPLLPTTSHKPTAVSVYTTLAALLTVKRAAASESHPTSLRLGLRELTAAWSIRQHHLSLAVWLRKQAAGTCPIKSWCQLLS